MILPTDMCKSGFIQYFLHTYNPLHHFAFDLESAQ